MEGRQLLQYLIDTSDVLLAKKQEATEYLAKIEEAAQHHEKQSTPKMTKCTTECLCPVYNVRHTS